MATVSIDIKSQLVRQISHWSSAAERLTVMENFATRAAWESLEKYLGLSLRKCLIETAHQLHWRGKNLEAMVSHAYSDAEMDNIRQQLLKYRAQYLQTETVIHFYADAVNTRTSEYMASLLRSCDVLSTQSMSQLFDKLGVATPPVLTYVDNGLGASILKAGLRLWDGKTISPAAAIKVTYHNLFRPTAIIHEAGHQVAHILNWNTELAQTLRDGLKAKSAYAADIWAGWASEVAADAFAFVNVGYAAVAALHDVLAGEPGFVFQIVPGDPHPMCYLRILLGIEMCKLFYKNGPWDDMEGEWKTFYNPDKYKPNEYTFIKQSEALLPTIAKLTLSSPQKAFRGHSLSGIIDPWRVSPESLNELMLTAGPSLFTSPVWRDKEGLRVLAMGSVKNQ